MTRLALLLLAAPAALGAQAIGPLGFDSRVETLDWRDGGELPLRIAVGGNTTLIFAPGEAVQSVLVGDPGAVDVQVAPQADSILVRILRKPASARIDVRTQLRDYRFQLRPGPANDVAYAVRFNIPAPAGEAPAAAPLPPEDAVERYAMKGEAGLRPARLSDDGARTYIEWGEDQPLPAVFAINPLGEEETVDSYIRQGVMVIDRVYPRLIFRIGKLKAQASRHAGGKAR